MEEQSLENIFRNRGYTSIQLQRSNLGHFEVEVSLDDQLVLMLLDTGATKSVLHTETAKNLNLKLNHESEQGGGLGISEATVNSTLINELKIGPLVIPSFYLYIMDFSHPIKSIVDRGGNLIDGVIGADILETREAIIEYKESKVYLK